MNFVDFLRQDRPARRLTFVVTVLLIILAVFVPKALVCALLGSVIGLALIYLIEKAG